MGGWVRMERWSDLDPRRGWHLEEGYEALSQLSSHWTLGYLRYNRIGLLQLLAQESPRLHELIHARVSHMQMSKASESMQIWKATANPHSQWTLAMDSIQFCGGTSEVRWF